MTAKRDTVRAKALVDAGIIRQDKACDGKVPYPNQNDARHAAKMMARRHGRPASTYKCPFYPNHYHVTTLSFEEAEAARDGGE